ncbi:MAG: PadR family transcriptional regulator [Thermoplasmatota archaeon]
MGPQGNVELIRFREKLAKELKSGLIGLVLLAAVERRGPEYGYRLLASVKEASDGRLHFKEGTAYPLLQRLEKAGLVSSYWGTNESGPPRRYYQATSLGKDALAAALDDWGDLVGAVTHTLDQLEEQP